MAPKKKPGDLPVDPRLQAAAPLAARRMELATAARRSRVSALQVREVTSGSCESQRNLTPSGDTSSTGDMGSQPQSRNELTAALTTPVTPVQRREELPMDVARARAAAHVRTMPALREDGASRKRSKREEMTCSEYRRTGSPPSPNPTSSAVATQPVRTLKCPAPAIA